MDFITFVTFIHSQNSFFPDQVFLLSYAKQLLAAASYLLYKQRGGVYLLTYLSARKQIKVLTKEVIFFFTFQVQEPVWSSCAPHLFIAVVYHIS